MWACASTPICRHCIIFWKRVLSGTFTEKRDRSFVGLDPVPVAYGMTIGEYARMLNGEGWLKHGVKAKLTVIPLANYTHDSFYSLPVKPSPNLPNDRAVMLYPSLPFFEGTVMSAGRGTAKTFSALRRTRIQGEKVLIRSKVKTGSQISQV